MCLVLSVPWSTSLTKPRKVEPGHKCERCLVQHRVASSPGKVNALRYSRARHKVTTNAELGGNCAFKRLELLIGSGCRAVTIRDEVLRRPYRKAEIRRLSASLLSHWSIAPAPSGSDAQDYAHAELQNRLI